MTPGAAHLKKALCAAAVAACLAVAACVRLPNTGPIQHFPLTEIGTVNGLAFGSDGRVWFTQSSAKAIGAIDARGSVTMYQNPINIDADGYGIAAGPDGAMWFTQVNPHAPVDSGPDMIARITTSGKWMEFPIPSWDALPLGIVAGPDQAMWFTERDANAIGRITMQGKITEYKLPHDGSGPTGITRGADGRIWFTETDGDRIGAIDPGTHHIVEFTVTTPKSRPGPIAADGSGDIFYIQLASSRIVRMSVSGHVYQRIPQPNTDAAKHRPTDIAAGAKNTIWVADAEGSIDEVWPHGASLATGDTAPNLIARSPHGDIWYAERKGPTFSYAGTAGIGEFAPSAAR